MKHIKKINELFDDFFKIKSPFSTKVDLTIIEYNGEKEVAELNISEESAKDICKAIYKDRDNGGRYGAYYT